MRRDLSQTEVERLFVGAVDGALAEPERSALASELAGDPALQAKFAQYQRAIALLKDAPREKAPEGLASLILRRTRRRRFGLRSRELHDARFPAEVIIPIVIAALAALYVLLAP